MKKHIEKAISLIKEMPIKGCITGSTVLGYFPDSNQDVDVFIYDEKSFNKVLFAMHHSEVFQILDPLEKWKFDQYIDKNRDSFGKQGLVTIKFTYNTCVPINLILKRSCNNIFSVLSSFDMDIVAKGYDIETRQTLDLSGDSHITKIASWNKWNTTYYAPELWEMNRVLRQLERVFKYHNRGYDTDPLVRKYIELINEIQKFQNIFSSESFTEKLKIRKENTKIIKQICELYLKEHKVTEDQIEVIRQKLKEI